MTASREVELELARITGWLRAEADRIEASLVALGAAVMESPELAEAAEAYAAGARGVAHGFRVAAVNLEEKKHRQDTPQRETDPGWRSGRGRSFPC